jgi:hypothetical protein
LGAPGSLGADDQALPRHRDKFGRDADEPIDLLDASGLGQQRDRRSEILTGDAQHSGNRGNNPGSACLREERYKSMLFAEFGFEK